MSMMATVSFFTRRGDRRQRIEDTLLVGPYVIARPAPPASVVLDGASPAVVAVFDGMGGRPAGNRASLIAATELGALHHGTGGRRDLAEVIVETGQRVNDLSDERSSLHGMGTTVAGIEVSHRPAAFNVGDSRVYSFRSPYLSPLTIDDVAAREAGGSGGLLQCLGAGNRSIEPHIMPIDGDDVVLLVCTDGLYRHCDARDLERAMEQENPISTLYAMAAGAADDVAVALVHLTRPAPPAPSPLWPPRPPESSPDVEHRTRRRRILRRGGDESGPPDGAD